MKKNICRLLAFVMILGGITIDRRSPLVNEAQAADFGTTFQYHQDRILSRESPPRLLGDSSRYNAGAQNEVLFSFPSGTTGSDNGRYTLEYAYTDGYLVRVTFDMGDAQTGVTYQMIDKDGLPSNKYGFGQPVGPERQEITGIRYYADAADGDEGRAIYNTDNPTGLTFPDSKTLKYPLTKGGGIAFKVLAPTSDGSTPVNEVETVKLFWNPSNSRIYYSTNQAKQGPKIYPFMLKGATEKTFAINTGYNLAADSDDVHIRRSADEYYTKNQYPSVESFWEKDDSGNYILDYTYIWGGATPADPAFPEEDINKEYPSAQDCEIIIDFALPQKIELDSGSPNYLQFAPVQQADCVTFYSDSTLGDTAIKIDNVRVYQESSGGKVVYDPSSGRGILSVSDLAASTVYSSFSFYAGPSPGAKVGPYETGGSSNIDGAYNYVRGDVARFGSSIYTFLKYELTDEDATNSVLIITPYKAFGATYNTQGEYRVYWGRDKVPGGDPKATAYVGQNDRTKEIVISLNFEGGDTTFYYRIEFVPSTGGTVDSQISKYEPSGIADRLQIPKDFTIISTKTIVVEDPDAPESKQDYARVKFSFATGLDEVLLNMADKKGITEVEYILSYGLTPKSDAALIQFLRLVAPLNTTSPGIVGDNISLSQADIDKKIRLLSATYDTAPVSVDNIQYLYGVITAEVLIPVGPKTSSSVTDILKYPNVYYSSVNGEYDDPTITDGTRASTASSNESQLNLNEPVKLTIPAPVNFSAQNPGTNSFDVSWNLPRQELFDYMDYMLNPTKLTLSGNGLTTSDGSDSEDSVKYDLYLGRDFEQMKLLVEGKTPANEREEDGTVFNPNSGQITVNINSFDSTGYLDAREFLRDGGIYKITGIEQSDFSPRNGERGKTDFSFGVTFTGLDDNTPYYVAAVTQVTPYKTQWVSPSELGVPAIETEGSPEKEKWYPVIVPQPVNTVFSGFTAVQTVTTTVNTDDPSPDEFEPPAPTGLKKENKPPAAVDILWDVLPDSALPEDIANNNDYRIEYQVLRVKDYVLPDSFLLNKGIIEDIARDLRSEYPQTLLAAWQTDLLLSVETGLKEILPSDRPGPVTHQATSIENLLLDASLTSGAMYVYYVRTVLTDAAGNPLRYSVWVPISVTTAPIDGPVNLRSERTGTYDKYKEALVSFDAPAQMSEIGNTYTLQISIKADDGDWGNDTDMILANLTGGTAENPELPGYYGYMYKITGLESGSTYSIRVRLVDNISGDKSMYSNVVTHRTEVDPDKPEDPVPKWEDYYKEKAEELLKRPYWPLVDKAGTSFEAAYRGSRFDGVISGAPEGVITLGKDARSQIYFIPAKAFAKAVAANEGLKIIAGNVTAIVPPEALDSQQTQALKDIIKQQNDKKIKDYYIELSISLSSTSERINGNNALTDRIDFSVKTVGFTEQELIWDANMEAELKLMLTDTATLNKVRTRLRNALDAGYTNQEMVLLVEQLVSDLEQDYLERVRKSFNEHRLYEYEAGYFAHPVRLVAVPNEQAGTTSISGFQLVQGSWQSLPTTPYGTGKSITPINPGTFIFSGSTVYIPGIENMQGGDAITNVVIKYGLDDFFGKGTSFNTATPVTNDALIGSIARLAGAKSTQDASAFLRDKGITVSTRNAYSPATNETTIYLLMSLYEIKTNTKITSMRITNQNIVKDIPGINQNYMQHYKAAYQMGIMDKNYMPKEQMSVKEFLTILGKLAGRANL